MLLGQMPGASLPGPTNLFAMLPSYSTAMGHFLSRFGPYRLLPYAPPVVPDLAPYQPIPPMLPVAPVPPAGRVSDPAAARLAGAGQGPYSGMSLAEARRARIDDMMRRGIATAADPFGSLNSRRMSEFGKSMVRSGLENGMSPERALRSAAFAEQRNAARGRYATPHGDAKRDAKKRDGRGDKGAASGGAAGRSDKATSNRGPGSRGGGFGHAGGPR